MYVNLYYKATTIFKFENASQMLCVGGLVFKEEIVEAYLMKVNMFGREVEGVCAG